MFGTKFPGDRVALTSGGATKRLDPVALPDLVDLVAAAQPARPAVITSSDTISFQELLERKMLAVDRLSAAGVGPGDRVIVALRSPLDALVYALAIWRAGAIHAPMSFAPSASELSKALEVVDPRLLVIGIADVPDRLDTRLVRIDSSCRSQVSRPRDRDWERRPHSPHQSWSDIGFLPVTGVRETSLADRPSRSPAATDPAVVFLTSGSSGRPKGVIHSHDTLVRAASHFARRLALTETDIFLAQLPLHHAFGMNLVMSVMSRGATLVIPDSSRGPDLLRAIRGHDVTTLAGTPTMFSRLIRESNAPSQQLEGLVAKAIGSGAPFSTELIAQIRVMCRETFELAYGSTEGFGISTRSAEAHSRGSVGKINPLRAAVRDDNGKALPDGAVGRIHFHMVRRWRYVDEGPNPWLPIGRASAEWVDTGDLGRVDEDGYLFVSGRASRVINRGGEKVDPIEVEYVLSRTLGIDRPLVVGLPDSYWGQIVCLCLSDASYTGPGMLVRVRTRLVGALAKHKWPEAIAVVPGVPLTALDKINYPLVLDEVQRRGTAESITRTGNTKRFIAR